MWSKLFFCTTDVNSEHARRYLGFRGEGLDRTGKTKCVFQGGIICTSQSCRIQHFLSKCVTDRDQQGPPPSCREGGSVPLAVTPAGNYSKMKNVLIVLWDCFCPLLNEFHRKRHLLDDSQCEINLFPEFRTNYPQGLGGPIREMSRPEIAPVALQEP